MSGFLKRSAAVVLIFIMCSFGAFASEIFQDVSVFMYQGDIILNVGDVVMLYAGAASSEEISVEAYWTINGWELPDSKDSNFIINGNRDSFFEFVAAEEMRGYSYEVAFSIVVYLDGEVLEHKKAVCSISVKKYSQEEIDRVFSYVTPMNATATVNRGTGIFSDRGLSKRIGWLERGSVVVYDAHHKAVSGHVVLNDGTEGWVSYGALTSSTKNFSVSEDIPLLDKDIFVNGMDYKSDTDYLVWVNLQRQKVNVFLKKNGNWSIERVMPCCSGSNRNPTVRGVFKFSYRQSMWDLGATCVKPIVGFYESYALHSIILYKNGRVYDGTLGRPASLGCVRMAVADINWLSANLPFGSTIVTY